ncbi:MAG: CPBP family intramembrane metalloprotease [Nocardioidaceae bacterium]|nr:CPBP family intramembrane metalloprotease [Nocardioidaceae bacterium]
MAADVGRVGRTGERRLSFAAFAVIVVAYLAIIQIGGRVAHAIWDSGDGFTTTRDVIVNMWVPLGAAFGFTYGVIAFLGWGRPVFHDERPVRRWVWAVPVILAVCILLAIDYADLGDQGIGFVLALLVATQLVGWGEEGMFRGVGVQVFRAHGFTEGKVALWSSVVFGAVHLTNALGSGGQAVQQAVAVSFAGYIFYLVRRVSRSNVLNSVLHGMFDFALLSGTAILVDQKAYPGSLAGVLAYLLIAVLVIVRRKSIELRR